jgi:isoquinoline 1-oxidoreductase subunit beta
VTRSADIAPLETIQVSRREFLVHSGIASCGVAFVLSGCDRPLPSGSVPSGTPASRFTANSWVTLYSDSTIEIITPGIELGQGAMTALPRLLAEELDADWNQVRVIPAPSDEKRFGNPLFWDMQLTAGSRTTLGYFDVLRIAGAQARYVLLTAAAKRWQVAVGELTTAASIVSHSASGRHASYAELIAKAEVPTAFPAFVAPDDKPQMPDDFFGEPPPSTLAPNEKSVGGAIPLKSKAQYQLLGIDTPRLDIPSKVNGSAQYGLDVQLPGMLYAMVETGPVQGGEPQTVNSVKARSVAGVTDVITLPYGVAVVGSNIFAVRRGREQLKMAWKPGAKARAYDSDATLADFSRIAADRQHHPGVRAFQFGDAAQTEAVFDAHADSAAPHIEVFEIRSELVYHAPLEPQNATVRIAEDGKSAEGWVGTQWPKLEQDYVAKVLQLKSADVKINTLFPGGSFGRRQEPGAIVDAAYIAQAVHKPVKVIWTREDDLKRNPFRQALVCRAEAAVSPEGRILATRHRVVADSWFARMFPDFFDQYKKSDPGNWVGGLHLYDVPLQSVDNVTERRAIDVCYLRGVGVTQTKFAQECLIDLIAVRYHKDPLEYRLEMLKSAPRAVQVIQTVAAMAEWHRPRTATALGMAYVPYSNSHAALVAEVSVDRHTGRISVQQVWCAVDCGFAVQPAMLASQMEGGILQGLSMALFERVSLKHGEVQQSNFHDYRLLRMSEAPDVFVKVLSTDNAVTGAAEIGVMPIAPAVNNALAKLIGKPLNAMPMLPENVLKAMHS